MKWIYKFCFINIGAVFLLAAFVAIGSGSGNYYIAYAGMLSLIWSVLSIVIGLVLLAFRQKQWAQGFLLTAGVLLLLGFIECSFSGMIA